MAEVQVPESGSAKDSALLALSILAVLGGIFAFYWYDELPLPLRLLMVFAGLGAGVGFVWFSWYGREFWQFAIASRTELRKVVWPEREETVKTTLVIFVFVAFMAFFFWLLDLLLTWLTRLMSGVS